MQVNEHSTGSEREWEHALRPSAWALLQPAKHIYASSVWKCTCTGALPCLRRSLV